MDNDWTKIRIGDVCRLKPGVQIEVSPDESGNLIDLSYYKAHDIANNLCLKESSRKIPENKIEPFQAGTLLVTCGGKIGRLGIIKEQAYASPNISGIQSANGNLLPEYRHLILQNLLHITVLDYPNQHSGSPKLI